MATTIACIAAVAVLIVGAVVRVVLRNDDGYQDAIRRYSGRED